MAIALDRIDHIVLNCREAETTISWYQRVLGMTMEEFGPERRIALKFGDQKFNVRPTGELCRNLGDAVIRRRSALAC